MTKREVAFFRGGLQLLHKKKSLKYLTPKKNNEQFADLRRGMVKKWGWCF